MKMATYRMIVDDLVSGITGMFVQKTEASGRERRYVIEYKPATTLGFASKVEKIPSTVPPEGIIEVAGSKCADGRPRMYIISYGRDDLHPPLVPILASQQMGDTIKKLDELSVATETKQESLRAQQRIIDSNRESIVKETMKLQKEVGGQRRPERGFLGMNLGEE